MKTALIISRSFPPFNRVDVIRVMKFVKYLHSFGWHPIVLTEKLPEGQLDAIDKSLEMELPKRLKVFRAPCPSLQDVYQFFGGKIKRGSYDATDKKLRQVVKSLLVPDPYLLWSLIGFRMAKKIIKTQKIDVVFTTSPNETTHLIGYRLRKHFACSWIADFRDPWIEKLNRPQRILPLEIYERYLQKKVLFRADHITVAWPGIARGFLSLYPDLEKKISILSNGYDESDFANLKTTQFNVFTTLFVGTLHQALKPESLFLALKMFLEKYPKMRIETQFLMVGRRDPFVDRLIIQNNLDGYVKITNQVSHKKCLEHCRGADILLFCIPDHDCIPSKIYEYMRVGRPILGVADPESDAFKVIRKNYQGECHASREPDSIARFIHNIYKKKDTLEKESIKSQYNKLRKLKRKSLTQKLSKIFEESCVRLTSIS